MSLNIITCTLNVCELFQLYYFTHHNNKCTQLKHQNRYLSIIIVCGYFSFIRSFT